MKLPNHFRHHYPWPVKIFVIVGAGATILNIKNYFYPKDNPHWKSRNDESDK